MMIKIDDEYDDGDDDNDDDDDDDVSLSLQLASDNRRPKSLLSRNWTLVQDLIARTTLYTLCNIRCTFYTL